ncbi:hypothetical protein CEXT_289241 [Caerostris extrusa]|uniref:Uncharacterized protein n=1 Tax=Caerostris extrusa TaxID=172846 RepID=A0AAV4RQX2_CAEEX|nr:hypothetical protein CEXT_289241 [Caerostris extrusa]
MSVKSLEKSAQLPQETRFCYENPVVREHKQAEAPFRKVSTFAKVLLPTARCGPEFRLFLIIIVKSLEKSAQLLQETRSCFGCSVVREHKQAEAPLRKVSTFAKVLLSTILALFVKTLMTAASAREERGRKRKNVLNPRSALDILMVSCCSLSDETPFSSVVAVAVRISAQNNSGLLLFFR